jgi:hypothetical protein
MVRHHCVVALTAPGIEDRHEQVALFRREVAVADHVEHKLELGVRFINRGGIVAVALQLGELFDRVPEHEHVFLADGFGDLVVGAVMRGNRKGAVERQLHVTGARGLGTRGRDLFRKIGGGDQVLRRLHVVIGDEHHFERTAHGGIVVDCIGDLIDQPDDALGHHITWCGLARKNHRPWLHALGTRRSDPVVACDHLQRVQELALVFMDALDLKVEKRRRIDLDPQPFADQTSKMLLVRLLDGREFLLERGIVREGLERVKLLEIAQPRPRDA